MNSQRINNRYLNIYFQVHQPRRLGQFNFFDIGRGRDYFDDGVNQIILRRIARECYQPTNLLLLRLIEKHPQIRITFSISGVVLRQMERFAPDVIESFRKLVSTGSVSFLSETYYHSLASLISPEEFTAQVRMHGEKIMALFGVKPTIFRNTELIYSDEIGALVRSMGFEGIFAEGHDPILSGRSPHHLYEHPDGNGLKLFFRNYKLSDDIAFRFAQHDWKHWPLSPQQYVHWLESIPEKESLVTLGLDYETFGEHHKKETGIFRFLEGMFTTLVAHNKFKMVTPEEAIALLAPVGYVSVPRPVSWADQHRDLSAWLGNEMQQDAFETIRNLEKPVKRIGDQLLLNVWRHLQTSDHLYYMSTKAGDDGKVHNYFSPYSSPYEAFMNYMNMVSDFQMRIEAEIEKIHLESSGHKSDSFMGFV